MLVKHQMQINTIKGGTDFMKKVIAIMLTLATLSVMGGWTTDPSEDTAGDFNLIKYLEGYEIQTPEEFQDVIETYTDFPVPDYSSENLSYFDIDIDYESKLVYVTTMNTNLTRTDTSNSASRDYYSSIGALIFSVSISGTFRYSYYSCTVLSKSGSYTKPSYSTWNSTPSITSGNNSATEAYARISGTAYSDGSSYSYSLTLACDNYGHFRSY